MRKIFANTFFLLLLCCFVFLLHANFCHALEVKYPEIQLNGETLTVTSSTKLPEYVKYLFVGGMFLTFFITFLSLVAGGAMYIMSPAFPQADLTGRARDRIKGALLGLGILVLTYLILITINPQLKNLKFDEPPDTSTPPPEKPAGLYLNKSTDCSDTDASPLTATTEDLGDAIRNKARSAHIQQDTKYENYYVAVLHDNVNLGGGCQYVDPNAYCVKVESVGAASSSIYEYDFTPNGDAVYFFRKSCFPQAPDYSGSRGALDVSKLIAHCKSEGGGWIKVPNSQIDGIYEKDLNDLKFQDVPEEEQDCVKYDENGVCKNREPPSLAGENISSIVVNGNYFVMLDYAGPGQQCSDFTFSSCQIFPLPGDANKIGPQQIKWEQIRNNGGVVPNCVTIVPVNQK